MAEIISFSDRARRRRPNPFQPETIVRVIDGVPVEYVNFDALSEAEQLAMMEEEPRHSGAIAPNRLK